MTKIHPIYTAVVNWNVYNLYLYSHPIRYNGIATTRSLRFRKIVQHAIRTTVSISIGEWNYSASVNNNAVMHRHYFVYTRSKCHVKEVE